MLLHNVYMLLHNVYMLLRNVNRHGSCVCCTMSTWHASCMCCIILLHVAQRLHTLVWQWYVVKPFLCWHAVCISVWSVVVPSFTSAGGHYGAACRGTCPAIRCN